MSETTANDFSVWVDQTAQLLRERRWQDIDLPKLVEEVEDLGKRERRSDSWLDSITDARTQIELTLEDSPNLKRYPGENLHESYQRARKQAAKQTQIALSVFPETCPYAVEQVLSDDWLPE